MNRRLFLGLLPAATLIGQERVESMTPTDADPKIACSHIGFLPGSAKTVVYRGSATSFRVRDIASVPKPYSKTFPLRTGADALGPCSIGDFSELQAEGMYQLAVGQELSVPFFVRPDLWRRTLPKAVSYHQAQRCGIAVPGVHPACHLDDARRRDNGAYVDVTGGWHDAGDLRKWMTATMTNAYGLLYLHRYLGDASGVPAAVLLDEVRWGNRYFLKMQDPSDGRVWADTAGGLNGDNSDNHWTDNEIGTEDDRYLNPGKGGMAQAMFVGIQAIVMQEFRDADPGYGRACLAAGLRCWKASSRNRVGTTELGWWVLAGAELSRATGDSAIAAETASLATQLAARQVRDAGYFVSSEGGSEPLVDAVYSAIPPMALLEAADALKGHTDASGWTDAVHAYVDVYVTPMCAKSAYGVMPLGLFRGSPTEETYRPHQGSLTFRYFLPVRKQSWWLGTTSHIELHAAVLARVGKRDLATRQLEWVMGANPFASCLMTGEGMRNVYPHSRYVGLINGGIVNGIAGNVKDEPVLDTQYGFDWRTTEYWSPHNAWYLWAVSLLERGA